MIQRIFIGLTAVGIIGTAVGIEWWAVVYNAPDAVWLYCNMLNWCTP